jgi:hypothetical protein
VFGYFNRSWDQEIDVPIGPNNNVEPGGPDQGQPTHFYPRRTRFSFRIHVPKDFGKNEVIWTVTGNGKTEKAYGSLNPDYYINNVIIELNNGETGGDRNNVAPDLKLDGGASPRMVKAGVPVTLTAVVTDDGIPKAKPMLLPGEFNRLYTVPVAAVGLRFSWLVYRGENKVSFDSPQFEAWEDTRDGRNSPFSPGWVTPPAPPGDKWVVRATFAEPGTYVLRALAHDGGLPTSTDVTFVVSK